MRKLIALMLLAGLAACAPHFTDTDPPPPHFAQTTDLLGIPQ